MCSLNYDSFLYFFGSQGLTGKICNPKPCQIFDKPLTGHLSSALHAFSCNSYLLRRRIQGVHLGVSHIPSLSGFSIHHHYRRFTFRPSVSKLRIVLFLGLLLVNHYTFHYSYLDRKYEALPLTPTTIKSRSYVAAI